MVNQYSKTVITLFFFSSIFQDYAQTVFINEISLCNISKELDPDFDYRGWIELYNASENDIDLNNLYFSDELGMPLKYRLFNKRIIPRKGYASIWINGEITDGGIKELDTDPDGGYISISDKNGKIIDDITYPKQITNVSWGRTFDGGADFDYFINSTYNNSNNDSNTASLVVSEPTFSIKGGFYSTSVSVSIDCRTEGSKIYYTLDGSDPTPKKNLYKGNPIIISKTHPLRSKAYADGYLDSRITTATYMINERIPNLPVIFLTTDTINLYNDSIGIYCIGTNGINVPGSSIIANYARDWTRPAHFEYLDKNDTIILSQPVGISISGNASREFDQKSLQVNSGKKYGKNRFDYPFFNDKKGCRIKSILLRNGGQMNGPGFFKDALLQSMTDILGIDHQAYETSVVYINGIYWGLLNIRERHNKDYIYSNYGYSDEIIDMIENNWREQVVCGDMIAYNKMIQVSQVNEIC